MYSCNNEEHFFIHYNVIIMYIHNKIFTTLQFDGTVYTFGFGSDHDATLLEAISTQGGGVYYYIDSNEKVKADMKLVWLSSKIM